MPTSHTTRTGLHWLELGSAGDVPAVVLIHGLGGDAGFWAAEQAALARSFRVLAIDLRGSGRSPGCSEGCSIGDLASDVATVLDEADIACAHLVGFSMGGVVAQAFALAAPARIKRLVLAATFATTQPQARLFLEAIRSVYRAGISERQLYELVLPWLFSERFLCDPRSAPYLSYPDEEEGGESSRANWLRLLDAQLAFDARPWLGDIRVPSLIICGADDRLAPLAGAKELARGIDGSVLEIIAGGHLMNVESPDAFVALIERFLLA